MPGSAHARRQNLFKKALMVWVVLIIVEFIHGILRAIFLVPAVGDFRTKQIGVFSGSVLILLVTFLFVRWLDAPDGKSLVQVGVLWLMLTIAFEFSFGHFLFGRSWRDLTSDYDILHGGFLVIGMAVLALSPLIARRLRRR